MSERPSCAAITTTTRAPGRTMAMFPAAVVRQARWRSGRRVVAAAAVVMVCTLDGEDDRPQPPDGGIGPRTRRTPRAPARARLPLLRFRPGGVGLDGATRGAGSIVRRVPLSCDARAAIRRVRSLVATAPERSRRIRLVAYGARLESVLGESPRGFESPILRTRTPRSNSPHQLSTKNQSAGENAMTATVTTLRVRPRRSLMTTAFV